MADFADFFHRLADSTVLGNTLLDWLIALAITIGAFLALLITARILKGRAKALRNRLPDAAGDVLVRLTGHVTTIGLLAIAIYLGSLRLALTGVASNVLRVLVVLAIAAQAVVWGNQIVNFATDLFLRRKQSDDGRQDAALATSLGVVRWLALVLVYSLIALLALQNMGVDITALVAGMGITGIAVALAVQKILGDLFSSLSIVLDKPFVVGDFIVVGDMMGTVERLGVKTTRVRSLSGEQLVFGNTDLLSSRIRNYKRMDTRRVVLKLGVTYQTPPDRLEEAVRIVREGIESQERARFDRCHFSAFADSSLTIEAVYYVLSADYNVYMDVHQAIQFHVLRRFNDEGIDFAYPTQTLFVERADAPAGSRNGREPAGVARAGSRDGN